VKGRRGGKQGRSLRGWEGMIGEMKEERRGEGNRKDVTPSVSVHFH